MSIVLSQLNRNEQDEIIMKPHNYIMKVPSKYHKRLGLAFNHWLKVPENKIAEVAEILDILHTTSLLIDDIQDDSEYRYGVPAAHHVHGLGQTINAASNGFAVALKKILALGHPQAINIFSEAILDGHRGQGIELYWRDNFICPTEEQYIDMLKQKTSAFFVLAIELLQLFSDNKEDLVEVAVQIGVYYAIRDDYCNLFNLEGLKSLAEDKVKWNAKNSVPDNDITDGKFTLPIIHALKYPESAKQIFNILKQRTKDINLINSCTTILENIGSASYTEGVLQKLEIDIHKKIARLGGNPSLTAILKELENWRRNVKLNTEGVSG